MEEVLLFLLYFIIYKSAFIVIGFGVVIITVILRLRIKEIEMGH